jgi:hypothetical protein
VATDAPVAFVDGADLAVALVRNETDGAETTLTVTTHPNPTTGATTVRYARPDGGATTVAVYDVLGRRVAVLHDGPVEAGVHTATWNARTAAPGVYVVRVSSGDVAATARLTVIR